MKVPKANYACIAKYYDKVRPPPANAWISKIIEYGKINDGSKVLDIGCGTGRYPLGILTLKNARICGLDWWKLCNYDSFARADKKAFHSLFSWGNRH